MSIQAVAWALEQDFTGRSPDGRMSSAHAAKLVLISLCNHADHVNGHCWPSAETIAREASCTTRSVYRLIAALKRNGYIDIQRAKGADGKQRSNNYWIRFDRQAAPWEYYSPDPRDEADAQDVEEPSDTESPGESVDKPPENPPPHDTESPGPSDIRVTRHIMPEPSVLEPSVQDSLHEQPPKPPDRPPPLPQALAQAERPKAAFEGSKPTAFDPNKRSEQVKALQAADDARKPKSVFVIEDSRAWLAWKATRARGFPVTDHVVDGKNKRGWWFPTLFPTPAEPQADMEALARELDSG